jgi:antitoxin (DNA-binding transcriptional repressor) of toxin-antitoxin stability system
VAVGGGQSVVITYHGEAVAELRPIASEGGTDARIEHLAERGLITQAGGRKALRPLARRAGALQRFLDERHGP